MKALTNMKTNYVLLRPYNGLPNLEALIANQELCLNVKIENTVYYRMLLKYSSLQDCHTVTGINKEHNVDQSKRGEPKVLLLFNQLDISTAVRCSIKCNKQCQRYCVSRRLLLTSGDIELNPGPVTQGNTLQKVTSISSMGLLLQSRLAEQGLQSLDVGVGGAGDCFFGAVSHQLYGDPSHHMAICTVGVQYMRDNPERFIESNTEHSWVSYLTNMSHQGTW